MFAYMRYAELKPPAVPTPRPGDAFLELLNRADETGDWIDCCGSRRQDMPSSLGQGRSSGAVTAEGSLADRISQGPLPVGERCRLRSRSRRPSTRQRYSPSRLRRFPLAVLARTEPRATRLSVPYPAVADKHQERGRPRERESPAAGIIQPVLRSASKPGASTNAAQRHAVVAGDPTSPRWDTEGVNGSCTPPTYDVNASSILP